MPSLYSEEMRILCLRSSPASKMEVSAPWRRRWWGGCWPASGPPLRARSPRSPCWASSVHSTRTVYTASCPEVCSTAAATPTPGYTAPPRTPPTTSSSSAWRTWWDQTSPSDRHSGGSPATGSPSSSTGPAPRAPTSGRRRGRGAPGNVVLLITLHLTTSPLTSQQVQESQDYQHKSGAGDKDAEYHRHVRHTALSLSGNIYW